MTTNLKTIRKDEKGFTLVELAIVMIIIGLLITGVLKGQELITNAQIASTVSQIKGIDAAVSTFSDKYNALPGDMQNPATRIPNCDGDCDAGGNGNRRIGVAPDEAQTGEALGFFIQLSKADLITGINDDIVDADTTFGGILPETNIGGGLHIGHTLGNNTADFQGATAPAGNIRAGHYLTLTSVAGEAITAADAVSLTPNQARRIDTKLDDGNAQDGGVIAMVSGNCELNGVYEEDVSEIACGLYMRIQE